MNYLTSFSLYWIASDLTAMARVIVRIDKRAVGIMKPALYIDLSLLLCFIVDQLYIFRIMMFLFRQTASYFQ